MQCKDKGGTKRVAGLYTKYKQKKMLQAHGEKMSGPESSPTATALRWHSPSALPPKVAAGGTGGPSPPQNAALFCG